MTSAREGRVLAATYGQGVFQFDERGATRMALPAPANQFSYLQSLLADRAGRLWVGTSGESLFQVEGNTARQLPVAQVGGGNPIALFEDSAGRVWIGGGGAAIAVFDGVDLQPVTVNSDIPPRSIAGFTEDAGGDLWAADDDRVFRRERDGPFVEFKVAGRSISRVACLKADRAGAVWLGTFDRGLLRWKDGRLTALGPLQGFPEATVLALEEDELGFLWMTTPNHLARARLSGLQAVADGGTGSFDVQVFDASDGLPGVEFVQGRQPAVTRDTTGRLWFATSKGVVRIDPAQLRVNARPPPVHIESIRFEPPRPAARARDATSVPPGDSALRLTGPFTAPVEFEPGSRRLEFHYAALSLVAPAKVRYQVRLEGLDPDWQDAADKRAVTYQELAPGDYVFRVRASNNDGVWNETGAHLAFTLQPHLWQTPWFRASLALALIGTGGGGVWSWMRTRLRRALEREQAAHAIRDLAGRLINAQEAERRRLARELHDDFSQSLALLSVEMEMVGQQAPTEPGRLTSRMQELSSQVKALSSEVHRISHELHPAKLEQLGLAAAVRGFCKELALAHELAIHCETGELPGGLSSEVALCLYRITQEALQNVAKHSHATSATVSLAAEGREFRLCIRDDGQGFDPATVRADGSLGLTSMRERARLVGGRFTITSQPGAGTQVEVRLPVPPQ